MKPRKAHVPYFLLLVGLNSKFLDLSDLTIATEKPVN